MKRMSASWAYFTLVDIVIHLYGKAVLAVLKVDLEPEEERACRGPQWGLVLYSCFLTSGKVQSGLLYEVKG